MTLLLSIKTNFGTGDIFNGVWGAFPYYESNKIVISDMSRGLYIVEFDNKIGGLIREKLIKE